MKAHLKSVAMIAIGCAIFAFGVDYFLLANGLAEGGFTGIGLLLHYKFGWPVGAFFILSNLPLILLGWRMWGNDFVAKTLTGVLLSSFFLELFHAYQLPVDNLLLPALYGGLLSGCGLGLVIRFGGTTGAPISSPASSTVIWASVWGGFISFLIRACFCWSPSFMG